MGLQEWGGVYSFSYYFNLQVQLFWKDSKNNLKWAREVAVSFIFLAVLLLLPFQQTSKWKWGFYGWEAERAEKEEETVLTWFSLVRLNKVA